MRHADSDGVILVHHTVEFEDGGVNEFANGSIEVARSGENSRKGFLIDREVEEGSPPNVAKKYRIQLLASLYAEEALTQRCRIS